MFIESNTSRYIVFSEDSILVALQKMSDNKKKIIFAVSESGRLEGVMTDGDFRRWLVESKKVDLNQSVSKVANKDCLSVYESAAKLEDLNELFSAKYEAIPLIDDYGHLSRIAFAGESDFFIGDHHLSEDSPAFVIGEVGVNHNGSIETAKKLVDAVAESGAPCAKFQMRDMASLYSDDSPDAPDDIGVQYTLDLLKTSKLSNDEMFEVFDYCKEKGVIPLCTPWDIPSVEVLERYGVEAYKVASADLTNHDLLRRLGETGKPIIMSTGMSREHEIIESTKILRECGSPYVLLQCNSTYPAPYKDVNLKYMDRLHEIGDCFVGYSGHERGFEVPIAAVARGAKVIEKHITLDKSMEGNDHKVSLLPGEFKSMVQAIRNVESSLGTAQERKMSQGEMINRENLAKSLVATVDIEEGQRITKYMIATKSPGKGLQPNNFNALVDTSARRNIKSGDYFYPSDIEGSVVKPRDYKFNRPWGVPVRFHDWLRIEEKSNPDFLEFHLSYKDMDGVGKWGYQGPTTSGELSEEETNEMAQYYSMDRGLVVHSPDLFSGDFLLNLAAEDEEQRKRSVKELQRVIDLTRGLKPGFNSLTPKIVASLGGFTKNGFASKAERTEMYDRVADSISQLELKGVELLPQTLPPFPWYFGGQLFCNIFVDPEDTLEFCKKNNLRVCLDISHSKLAMNHAKRSFKEYIDIIAPIAGHLHIVDSVGVDGEGIQIGEGEIDFAALAEQLDEHAPGISFIPEIWQGHKNGGEGFWVALDRLEKWF